MFPIDVLIPLKEDDVPYENTLNSLKEQQNTYIKKFLVYGDCGANKQVSIVNSRNKAKHLGTAPYVFFLDSDIIIPDHCLNTLCSHLKKYKNYGAVGMKVSGRVDNIAHVSMAAILWKREILDRITFRENQEYCECLEACNDVRDLDYLIEYHPFLNVIHISDSL